MQETGLNIPRKVLEQMLGEAAANPAREICGLVLGEGQTIMSILPCTNIASDPAQEFEIDPAQLIAAHKAARSGAPQIIGHYHSHPNGRCEPSDRDREMIGRPGEIWIILAKGLVRAFVANPDSGGFAETVLNGLETQDDRSQ